jgi:hypothetical protein
VTTRDELLRLIEGRSDPSTRGVRVTWDEAPRPNTGLNLRGRNLQRVDLTGLQLPKADFEGADLRGTLLNDANLFNANLRGAKLNRARLLGTSLVATRLEGADLRQALVDGATDLSDIRLFNRRHGGALVSGVRWGDANLMDIDWEEIEWFGETRLASAPFTELWNTNDVQRPPLLCSTISECLFSGGRHLKRTVA